MKNYVWILVVFSFIVFLETTKVNAEKNESKANVTIVGDSSNDSKENENNEKINESKKDFFEDQIKAGQKDNNLVNNIKKRWLPKTNQVSAIWVSLFGLVLIFLGSLIYKKRGKSKYNE